MQAIDDSVTPSWYTAIALIPLDVWCVVVPDEHRARADLVLVAKSKPMLDLPHPDEFMLGGESSDEESESGDTDDDSQDGIFMCAGP